MKRDKMKVRSTPGMEEVESRREQRPRTFIPLNGLATDGKPWAFKRTRNGERRKYRLRS